MTMRFILCIEPEMWYCSRLSALYKVGNGRSLLYSGFWVWYNSFEKLELEKEA